MGQCSKKFECRHFAQRWRKQFFMFKYECFHHMKRVFLNKYFRKSATNLDIMRVHFAGLLVKLINCKQLKQNLWKSWRKFYDWKFDYQIFIDRSPVNNERKTYIFHIKVFHKISKRNIIWKIVIILLFKIIILLWVKKS